MTKVMYTGFAMPDYALFHPNDWEAIRLLPDATGNYLWGPPSTPGPATIWGLPVLQSTAETENTAIVGAFGQYSKLVTRMGTSIEVGMINDDFVKNQRVILAEMRAAFYVRRPTAFCKVTGI
jgi:HK97 family phage major capsid protein